ncbi:probable methyltransferase TCM_000336 [Rhodamnia argentea]|uniref:Probable methyltransferase TCM_000336 n=1 Tax=Rhodamnia argentea TaxID=178133 RepID=A0A8B8NNI7_9MYRT|nr:probable methyltransferase TCM_000336 [Rhodamnia argentea]
MDVEKIFHMTGGVGNTSYAKNSSLQKKASDMVKSITMEAVQQVYLSLVPESIGIADLGCSSGPNTLSIIRDVIGAVEGTSQRVTSPAPEFRVYLNDLPTNDFNSIFKALPDFHRELREARRREGGLRHPPLYMAAHPGSFYGRLFPNKCLHFVYSSYSLHWLSRVPPALSDEKNRGTINKGSIYISDSSPPCVAEAYLRQFQEDFTSFLRLRSQELVSGGRMVLILLGRRGADHIDRGNSFFWELLTRSLSMLVAKGEVKEEKLDSYEVHFYAPSRDEMEHEIEREGSFRLDRFETFELEREEKDGESYGTAVATTVRAIQESMISHHFGEGIVDGLFENYARILDEEAAREQIRPVTFLLALTKL